MNIEINGKEFKINDNMRFGVLKRMQEDPENLDNLQLFLKDVLIPMPTAKEIFNIKEDDLIRISKAFEDLQKEKSAEAKKKRSQ